MLRISKAKVLREFRTKSTLNFPRLRNVAAGQNWYQEPPRPRRSVRSQDFLHSGVIMVVRLIEASYDGSSLEAGVDLSPRQRSGAPRSSWRLR